MTKRARAIIVAGLMLGVLTACKTNQTSSTATANNNSSSPSRATPDQFAADRATYDKECKNCHGSTGTGGPVKLEDGTKLKVPSLREGHALRHPDSDYVKQITK